ncbi:MAG: ABC transporter substrate-binding protein [Bdellovibrio sp. CG10_big_fil_rev_8_21_14_0_10_47_8]|nr:MAG: ABC transporter substrate-binding protein [Bdellovibrio sp. CG10_big_fil_rev_8_21_14_0_10_47_8]
MTKSFLALTFIFALSAPMPASAALANDEFKIGITQEFENMNPLIMTMSASLYMYGLVGRALVSMNTSGKWYPQLAKSIPTIENGGAKIITVNGKKTVQAVWEIVPKAKWSDGKPVTCEDFQFARNVAENPNVSIASKETYTQVEKIEWDTKTPQKCTFTYDKARWDFNQLGQFFPLPKHLEEAVYKQWGSKREGYETNSNYNKNPTMAGLYNGPYIVQEVKLGSHVSFIPNKYFYGSAPHLKRIVIKLIPNTGTLEANLRSGTIDAVSSLGFSFDQALAFEKRVKSESLPFNVSFKPSLTYEHIDLNLDNPLLKDVRVRKALVFAINREDLVKALFEGKQTVAIHNLASIDPWYTNDPKKIVLYPYSKREASKLLDEAGWKMEKDGYRHKDGKKLTLQFMSTAGNKIRETVQPYLQAQWKTVGIDVQIKNEPARVFFGETTKKRNFGAMAMFAWVSSPEVSPKPQFHSSQIPTAKNGWSGQNITGWNDKKVDELCEKIDVEFDSKKRIGLAHELLKLYTDEVPTIPLYYRADVAVVPKTLKGFHLAGHQFSETNEVEKWQF